jgi:hypothetical protein
VGTTYRVGDRVVEMPGSTLVLKVVGVSRDGETLFVHLDTCDFPQDTADVFEIASDDARLVERSVRR